MRANFTENLAPRSCVSYLINHLSILYFRNKIFLSLYCISWILYFGIRVESNAEDVIIHCPGLLSKDEHGNNHMFCQVAGTHVTLKFIKNAVLCRCRMPRSGQRDGSIRKRRLRSIIPA